ncbi:SMI1/KNR4 family protein [Comamonas sp. AG1104]|uniref:SMI1/KNR4 family protein n=1 Tax=Comamonas sp. AG1104 TaxID=2183900 RepID=UPI000E0CBA2C|nr:SMI1/KNR4 family protein [Comamonas sp. AG1104]RDI07179.1 hypothetical protein DFO48_110104 [Comamonas sp. AG1104]
MQVLFPNPFGQPAASAQEVAALQAHIGFSDAYAQFLITQNGFSMYALEQASDHASYLQHSTEIASESHANFADLFSFGAQQHQEDLKTVQSEFLLARWFVAIGHDQGGNPFVEVLHGRHKGKIGSLDHDLFLGASDLQEFFGDMELEHIAALSLADQADALCDPTLGLIWFHASDLNHFTACCIHCDDGFWGFVVDEPKI